MEYNLCCFNHSFHREDQYFDSPCALLSLITANGILIEEPQQISHPVLLRRRMCCWGGTFFLKTPLEHIPKYSLVLIEFFNRRLLDSSRSISTAATFNSSSSDKNSSLGACTLLSDLYTESISTPAADPSGEKNTRDSSKHNDENKHKWKIGQCRLSLDMLTTQFDLRVAVSRPDVGEVADSADSKATNSVSVDVSVFLR